MGGKLSRIPHLIFSPIKLHIISTSGDREQKCRHRQMATEHVPHSLREETRLPHRNCGQTELVRNFTTKLL